ncbi:MAG: hypothetical protein NWR72_12720 [Bacteroidia bacterium]|nr:hypothetical protein [Bacteroidia bacterium]
MRQFICVGLLFSALMPAVFGQEIVKQKPTIPHQVRDIEACQKGYQWIKGSWVWDSRSQEYLWVPGHCERGRSNKVFFPGSWVRLEEGWMWAPGYWEKISRIKKGKSTQ